MTISYFVTDPKTIEQNNTAINVEQTPEQKESTNNFEKGGTKMLGFEIISGIFCLLGMFLYKRR